MEAKYIVKAEKPDKTTVAINITPRYNEDMLLVNTQIEMAPIEHKIEMKIPI